MCRSRARERAVDRPAGPRSVRSSPSSPASAWRRTISNPAAVAAPRAAASGPKASSSARTIGAPSGSASMSARWWRMRARAAAARAPRGSARCRPAADAFVRRPLERALQRWLNWQPGTRLDSWVFGIMRNAWLDELRARRRRGEVLLAEEAGAEVAAAGGAQPLEALAIEAALHELPEEQRMAVLLVLVEGLSYKEAAEALGVPIGTLTSRLSRGREALARTLA